MGGVLLLLEFTWGDEWSFFCKILYLNKFFLPMTTPKSYPSKHYRHFRKGIAFPFPFSEVRAMSTLPFQGGVIFRTFVPDSGFGTYSMSEEVGQLIRRIWANLSTNQIAPFFSCSHEASAIENLHRAHKYRLFSYCYAHFF